MPERITEVKKAMVYGNIAALFKSALTIGGGGQGTVLHVKLFIAIILSQAHTRFHKNLFKLPFSLSNN